MLHLMYTDSLPADMEECVELRVQSAEELQIDP
jgi:hypothetical protein